MSHEIDFSTGEAAMAYVNATPWHGLGFPMPAGAPLELWAEKAHLDWEAKRSPMWRNNGRGALALVKNQYALYRSDTGDDLGIVGPSYQIVQPAGILGFFRQLVESMELELEVAGALLGGKKIWALAKTHEDFILPGNDKVKGYILLATSFDKSMATTATRTSVRVVCDNTMRIAIGDDGAKGDIRIGHNQVFNADVVRSQLGLNTSSVWDAFQEQARATAERKVTREEAVKFFLDVLYPGVEEIDTKGKLRNIELLELIRNTAPGQATEAANDSAWGLVNTVTYFVDHARKEKQPGSRLNRAWFGDGDAMKSRAFEAALKLAA